MTSCNRASARALTAMALLLATLALSGCWSRKELDTVAIVAGMGVDRPTNGGDGFLLTAQIINPSDAGASHTGSGAPGEAKGTKPVWIAQTTASTVAEGISNFAFEMSRRIYLSHNQVIVVGGRAARLGVLPIIDYFLRAHECRLQEWVLVVDGRASAVLEAGGGLEKIPARALAAMVVGGKVTSQVVQVTLKDFAESLVSSTRAPVAPKVEVFSFDGEKRLRLAGTAVFRGDRWVGDLSRKETRGLLWVLGEVENGVIVLGTARDKERFSAGVTRSSASVRPKVRGSNITIHISVDARTQLADATTQRKEITPGLLRYLGRAQAAAIEQEVRAAYRKARSLHADIFGFGEAIAKAYPAEWKSLEAGWAKSFTRVKLEVSVRASIERIGNTLRTASPE